jgi:hypothetical protein
MGPKWNNPLFDEKRAWILFKIETFVTICENLTQAKQPFGKSSHPETKKENKRSFNWKPNTLLGRQISIKQIIYPSIAEASPNRYSKKNIEKSRVT